MKRKDILDTGRTDLANQAYYHCTKCDYKQYTKDLAGPQHLICFKCEAILTWKPVTY